MFVKICKGGHETLYECKTAEWHPHSIESCPKLDAADLVLNGGTTNMAIAGEAMNVISIKCEPGIEVYYMNNEGKTIDRKVW